MNGRPPLSPADRKSIKKGIRFRASDRDLIEARAIEAGMTVSEFLRRCALGEEIVRYEHKDIDPAIKAELHSLGQEINQIAKALNAGEAYDPEQLETACKRLSALMDDIQAQTTA